MMSRWQYVIAAFIITGFFGVLLVMMTTDIEISAQFDKPFSLLIGALIGNFATVVGYFFGSSKGSSDKNETIKKAIEKG